MIKCPYCFEEIQDDAQKCKHCNEWLADKDNTLQKPSEHQDIQSLKIKHNIHSHLVLSIISVLFCCLPGLFALLYSSRVDTHLKKGEIDKAMSASKNAQIAAWLAIILGILALIGKFGEVTRQIQ